MLVAVLNMCPRLVAPEITAIYDQTSPSDMRILCPDSGRMMLTCSASFTILTRQPFPPSERYTLTCWSLGVGVALVNAPNNIGPTCLPFSFSGGFSNLQVDRIM